MYLFLNRFLNLEVARFLNLPGAYLFRMIFVLLAQEIVGKVSLRSTIVKGNYTIPSNMVNPKYDPRR
jgi:hypothetical protein